MMVHWTDGISVLLAFGTVGIKVILFLMVFDDVMFSINTYTDCI